MVEILNLNLDADIDEEIPNINFIEEEISKDQREQEIESKFDDEYQSLHIARSVTVQSSKHFTKQSYTDIFSKAVTMLRDIIRMETEFKLKFNKILLKDKYLSKKVFPQMMKDEKMNEYLDLKICYQRL